MSVLEAVANGIERVIGAVGVVGLLGLILLAFVVLGGLFRGRR